MMIAIGALLLAFSLPLYQLARFSLREDLYSHIILIPVVSLYLIWARRRTLPPPSMPARPWAAGLLACGGAVLVWRIGLALSGVTLIPEDALALTTLSFLLLLTGCCAWFLGRETIRAIVFPLAFLIFMVPLPAVGQSALETFLQHGSAEVAYWIFRLSGMPIFRDGLVFQLPGFSLEVAPQCSGIHSTVALFITSVLAAHLFLRSPWKQVTLALVVIPLALLRNGFRVFVIGTLCVRISPDMINSYIHRHGGPIFFVLSLVPFVLVLLLLSRSDRRRPPPTHAA